MATIATQRPVLAGAAIAYVAAAVGGDDFIPEAHQALHFKNTDVAARSVTLITPGDVEGQAIADLVVVVPAGGDRLVKVSVTLLRHATTGKANMTYDAVTGLTMAVLAL